MNGACNGTFFLAPPPGALGRDQKVKYHNEITKSISKIFKPNFVCLLTNERYKTYQTGFSFGHLGHAPGVGVGGTEGVWEDQKKNSEIQPDFVCVLLTYMNGTCNSTIFGVFTPGALGRGQKGKYHLI